ncbi:MAG TPA: hypothetical protein VN193_17005 [Candidatus Angelobacter sp.]|nr:hypothetical protein [Candidatus Angelobacter sp.]
MRTKVRLTIAALATTAALWIPTSAAHAGLVPCAGYGGQGVGGYVSSLVQSCTSGIIH